MLCNSLDLLEKQIMVLLGCMLFCQVALLWQAFNAIPAVVASGRFDACN
jgi:hypothetical protein